MKLIEHDRIEIERKSLALSFVSVVFSSTQSLRWGVLTQLETQYTFSSDRSRGIFALLCSHTRTVSLMLDGCVCSDRTVRRKHIMMEASGVSAPDGILQDP